MAAPTDSSIATAVRAVAGRTPLVLDSPHSGTRYPEDFRTVCPLDELRRAEDTHVEKLYAFAPQLGIAWIEAFFPRSYLDANRSDHDVDATMLDGPWPGPVETDPTQQSKLRLGKGLVWKNTDEGKPLYDRLLSPDEVQRRIATCWRPYHAAVAAAIEAAHARHGYSLHLNCHSMPSVAGPFATEHPGVPHADIVLGDRDGTAADPGLTERMALFLRERGYDVAVNFPYKGVELIRRYSDPKRHRHGIQVEINRKLYMDESSLELLPSWQKVQGDLRAMVEWLLGVDPRGL